MNLTQIENNLYDELKMIKLNLHNLTLLPKITFFKNKSFLILFLIFPILVLASLYIVGQKEQSLSKEKEERLKVSKTLEKVNADYETLKNQDQIKRNDELQKQIKEIENAYNNSISTYESITDLPSSTKELPQFRKDFAQVLKYLSERNYSSASSKLATLKSDVDKVKTSQATQAPAGVNLENVAVNNTPPGSGYSRQRVDAAGGSFLVDLVAGNMATTRIIVDTATDGDCRDNCPVLSLGEYVSRNGAYAGINGSYFCPAEYPTCAGKTNSFDTLAMNKNKKYINSDNNVYSTVPAVIFLGGSMRFVGQSQEWGRDNGVDGVLANQPLLISGGNVAFGGDQDPKKGSVGNRSFIANKGNTAYIGVVRGVTVVQSALVLKALGMENALNLDSGGSTALWASGGYKAGPGRNIPNAILFVNK